ncbi:hypothetical protein FisN_22Lh243 [Fistulifera solaris]|uniref:Uncharacterized protein n=1 Tax=Fistulifera solaris TaxID=1519565 RepID=A0A1Z5JC19_FISSO|nr:hypothetical protein FisN_22Lh243 [Fistulifera solaris]|eukprot:GAX11553.1 hypothetical protein FisN_22Lh243 [Fistulifera solaris]
MNFFNQHNDLKDQLFCMREERNFFQSKYTEQVKEIESLKRQLELASNEILRLRRQVMQQRNETDDHAEEEKKTDGVERKQDEDEEEAIRRKASSLLQWAEYRENSPGKSALLYELNDEDEEHEEEDSFDEDEKEQDEVVPLSVLSALTVDSGDPF